MQPRRRRGVLALYARARGKGQRVSGAEGGGGGSAGKSITRLSLSGAASFFSSNPTCASTGSSNENNARVSVRSCAIARSLFPRCDANAMTIFFLAGTFPNTFSNGKKRHEIEGKEKVPLFQNATLPHSGRKARITRSRFRGR